MKVRGVSQCEADAQMAVLLVARDPQEADVGLKEGCVEIFGQSALVSQSFRPWSSVLREQSEESKKS